MVDVARHARVLEAATALSLDDRVETLAADLQDAGYYVGPKPWRRVHTPVAAYVLGLKLKTVQNRVAQGLPPTPFKVGGSIQFALRDLVAYVEGCKKDA